MEEYLTSYIAAFFSACIISYFRVYSSDKFHNYFFLITIDWFLVLNCIIYGCISVGLLYLLKDNVVSIPVNNTQLGHYLYPIGIGIITKGVADINFFNVKADGFSIPIGLKTFTHPLDKFFEEKFDGVCFEKSKVYMESYLVKYRHELLTNYCNDIGRFKTDIILKLNSFHPDKKKTGGFETSLDFTKASSVEETLVLVLREFGPTIFNSIFPL
jgi:hypothetical protein